MSLTQKSGIKCRFTEVSKREENALQLYNALAGKQDKEDSVVVLKMLCREESKNKQIIENIYDDFMEEQATNHIQRTLTVSNSFNALRETVFSAFYQNSCLRSLYRPFPLISLRV